MFEKTSRKEAKGTNALLNGSRDVNWYLTNFVFTGMMLLLGYGIFKSKRGWFVSTVVTPMTMSSEEKWKKVNKARAIAIFVAFVPLFVANAVFFLLKLPEKYGQSVFVLAVTGLIAEELFTLVYADILERKWLKEQKEKGNLVSDFVFLSNVPKKTIVTGAVILIAIFLLVVLSAKIR